jgi:hypothetical protein
MTGKIFFTPALISSLIACLLMLDRSLAETSDRLDNPARWSLITDQVMGGVSSGEKTTGDDKAGAYVGLTGLVSTQNNGGFIQIRHNLEAYDLTGKKAVKLTVSGNNERYYVFIRTKTLLLPWQFYAADFRATPEPSEVVLPLANFERSNFYMRRQFKPENIKSIGIVAYGRDHKADIKVHGVGFTE